MAGLKFIIVRIINNILFLTSHRRNELQLESTIRLIAWTHKHKDLEAFLKWPHAKAIRPYRPRLHDQNRNL